MQTEIRAYKEEAYERGKYDFNFFAAVMLPDLYAFAFPPFYLALFTLLTRAKDNPQAMERIMRFALGLPRGFAKTTFMKLIACYFIVYDLVDFLLVVCANEDLAEAFLADVSDTLGGENAEKVYGVWTAKLAVDNKQKKKIYYHGRNVILKAVGAGSSVRGVAEKFRRPDFILCDDVQTREKAESETESAALLRWLVGTLFKTIAPQGKFRLIAYLGNMYPENSILAKLREMPKWYSLVTGAILESGDSLWPELHSLEDLLDSFEHDEAIGLGEVWMAEVMNDPDVSRKGLLPKPLVESPYPTEAAPDGAFITIDPAGFKSTADDNVITGHHIIDNKGIVKEMAGGRLNPQETIETAVDMALRLGASVIGVEAAGYQATLIFWAHKVLDELGIDHIQFVELPTNNQSKLRRIQAFIGELMNGDYYIERAEDRATFSWYALRYKVTKKNNRDDWLDGPAYGVTMRQLYWREITNLQAIPEDSNRAKVQTNNTPF